MHSGTTKHGQSSSGRRADIQGLRAVAVLMVVAFHAGLPVRGGFVGVDVFFVISGFVITLMLSRERLRSGRIRLGKFFLRRFKRLTPALALMIAVTLIISAAILSPFGPQQTVVKTAVGAMLISANFVVDRTTDCYFCSDAALNPLAHTWSLSVEDQFYLIFPCLLALSWWLAERRRFPFGAWFAMVGFACLSFILAVIGSFAGIVASHDAGLRFGNGGLWIFMGFYSPFSRAWEFAAGALLAIGIARLSSVSGRFLSMLGFAGFCLIGASALLISPDQPFPGPWTTLPVIGTLMLLAGGTHALAPTTRFLSSRPMAVIGDWSYSIYLWHWPFIVFASQYVWHPNRVVLLGAAVASLVPAVLSYRWVEQPIRNLESVRPRRLVALVASTIIPPAIIGAGLWFGCERGWWSEPVRRLQAATLTAHIGDKSGCELRAPLGSEERGRCEWNEDAPGEPIYLVGDSHADHFSEAVIGASADLDRPVVIATAGSCPFVDVNLVRPGWGPADNGACRRYVQGTLNYLRHARHGLVVISNYDWSSSGVRVVSEPGDSGRDLLTSPDRRIEVLRDGLGKTVATLQSFGFRVLLVQDVPQWIGFKNTPQLWDVNRCSLLVTVRGRCVATRTLESAEAERAATRTTVAEVSEKLKTGLWDPGNEICPAGVCSTEGPSFVRYHDATHISVEQSIALAPSIRDAIELFDTRP